VQARGCHGVALTTAQKNNMAAQMENSEQSAAAIQKSISAAFDIFDHESNKTVDMR
jgi:hypothetical protein